jgi:hypothetical protein
MTTALSRLFAVQHDEFAGRSRAADLLLHSQKNSFQSSVVNVLQNTAEGGLAGSRGQAWPMPMSAEKSRKRFNQSGP